MHGKETVHLCYQHVNNKAYIAHMQAMHAKDQMWFKRLVRGLCLSGAPLNLQSFCSVSYQL